MKLVTQDMQEAFDLVVAHLSTLPRRAGFDDIRGGIFKCMYRSPVGPCAAGILIETENDEEELSLAEFGNVFNSVTREYPFNCSGRLNFLISLLQGEHDDESNWDDAGFRAWDGLVDVADSHGLNVDVVNAVRP